MVLEARGEKRGGNAMGAFFTSYCLPGDVHELVDRKLADWLSRKGFTEPADPVLDLCPEGERAYYLFWNERWTIILYSRLEEEERLLFELGNIGHPVLHLWLHDSDLWGYELYRKNRPIAAFNSNPKYFGAQEVPAAPNDISVLIEQCAIRGLSAPEVEALQRKRGVFQEDACTAFLKAIGAAPAASQYQYQSDDRPAPSDFSVVHRRNRRRGFDPMRNFNLHAKPPKSAPGMTPAPAQMPSLPAGFRLLMEVVRIVAIPIGWLFGIYLRIKIRTGGLAGLPGAGLSTKPKDYSFENGWLVNSKRRCRIKLADGAEISNMAGILPFRIGKLEVFSKTMSAEEALHLLDGLRGKADEEERDFHIGGLPAKWIRLRIPPKREGCRYHGFIQAPHAVYYFLLESKAALSAAEHEALEKTIGSFEVVHPAQAG
jgi:hypothetical protein